MIRSLFLVHWIAMLRTFDTSCSIYCEIVNQIASMMVHWAQCEDDVVFNRFYSIDEKGKKNKTPIIFAAESGSLFVPIDKFQEYQERIFQKQKLLTSWMIEWIDPLSNARAETSSKINNCVYARNHEMQHAHTYSRDAKTHTKWLAHLWRILMYFVLPWHA